MRVYMPTELWAYIRNKADTERTTMTRIVNKALLEYFGDVPGCKRYIEKYADKPLTTKQHHAATKRRDNIARIAGLLQSTNEWISRTALARAVGCSRKSITRYIPELTARYPIVIKYQGQGGQMYVRWKGEE